MIEIKEELNRYVIATFGNPTTYLSRINRKYCFIDNLKECTKYATKSVANEIIKYFYLETKLTEIELVVLPLKIEYRLINETNNEIDNNK